MKKEGVVAEEDEGQQGWQWEEVLGEEGSGEGGGRARSARGGVWLLLVEEIKVEEVARQSSKGWEGHRQGRGSDGGETRENKDDSDGVLLD